ncbi:MAG: DUF2520 domain-containing protein [Syntrophomonadaceae bacterium]|jgi:predicted short-subunit dehydrogenase-like oxidoreductase (DUF2520 family)|nr:DUF2520 domain-containing protein [Syntrophomonadaceae bacterium]
MTNKVGIIGLGVVGTAVGVVLSNKGYEITGVYDKLSESTKVLVERIGCTTCSSPQEVSRSADILFITTSDMAIKDVADELAESGAFHSGQVVIHMSGSLTSQVLDGARAFGAFVLSIHPLQSFADVDRAIANLQGSVFSIEGDREAYAIGRDIVANLGGEHFIIDRAAKVLYHAGACTVSNYLVTVVDFGIRLLEAAGIPREQGTRALLPLIQGSVNNISDVGIPKALTGPIARGDVETVLHHLKALDAKMPADRLLYACLGLYTTSIACAKGTIGSEQKADFAEILANVIKESLEDKR